MSKKVTYIKTSSINRKFSQLIAAIVLLIVTLNIWASINFNGQTLINENAQVLADNILVQSSHSAAHYIENNDIEALNTVTESVLKSKYIVEMVVYDNRGVVLSRSENALSTKDRFLNPLNDKLANMSPKPYVTDVTNELGELIGFVRITVMSKALQQDATLFVHTISKTTLLIALLAGMIGYLLTIGLRPFSANSYIVRDTPD
ncbi:hypothetical protein KO525_16105 [Psychrosphaera sp. B3R10]|uniref:AhpA/YtjB family protein n=1 Tax=unclassified Psychrosphaera TaxID=2641570 RepID=UPI001C0924B0|nr:MULTISPECIES: AhpA/YtjB family protein [unclassified Psychrosphaera]MBU2880871.1 hypothetical protein [Psychrosphaera sp. I2R16]MBU2990910.1 hypothetical protein [Psychrosphaera sp. B3R10]